MQRHVEHQLIVEPIRLSPERVMAHIGSTGQPHVAERTAAQSTRAHTAFSSGVLALNSARCLKWKAMSVPRIIEMICERTACALRRRVAGRCAGAVQSAEYATAYGGGPCLCTH